MNNLDSRLRTWIVWALPFVVIGLLIGWETDWGQGLKRVPALDRDIVPRPVAISLLPEYKVDGGTDGNRETTERTLFNPTRRPAPPAIVAASKASMPKGQFVLTGTTVVDQKATAFLREVNGGKPRRVQQGETINGMLVAEVRADRVKFTQNDDVEELTLRVAAGPKTTIQPVAPPPPGQPGGPVPGTPGAPVNAGGSQQATGDVAEVLANRRRAARAADAASQAQRQTADTAAAAAAAGSAATAATPAAAPAATPPAKGQDPGWNDVYQRYMQQRQRR
jgi:hypothetical protein